MPQEHWRERAALKARTRERVRTLASLPFSAYVDEAEAIAGHAMQFLETHGRDLEEGRLPPTRKGFAAMYKEAHALSEGLAAASFALDEEDPFHLFGTATDRLRRAYPFLSDEEARRFVILKLHDFTAPAAADLPLRGALAESLFQASMDYHRLVALKTRILKEPLSGLQRALDLLGRYAPIYAGVPETEVPTFQALPLERRLSLIEGASALGKRFTS